MKYFTASSGNRARYTEESNTKRIGVSCTWQFKPTQTDLDEFKIYFSAVSPEEIAEMIEETHGSGEEAKAKSREYIKRFLETGDPHPKVN